jgi:hypothetical protein
MYGWTSVDARLPCPRGVKNDRDLPQVESAQAGTAIAWSLSNTKGYQMADNLQQRGTRDRSQISLSHQHELVYWTKRFSVRGEQLRRAVAAVGPIADDVERYLKSYEARH